MKRLYVAAIAAMACSVVHAQSLSEDFDSHAVGDYMGVVSPDWTTWSGTTGGAEDVQVTDAAAQSGSNSIYFSSTAANGGPQDVVVPFGGVYNTGTFVFENNMYVENGRGAYFNFQANSVIGQVWCMNMNIVDDGNIFMDDGVSVLAEATYNSDEWFNLRVEANLNTNEWELFINDVSFGVSQNSVNQVASLDIFPTNGNYGGNGSSGFYVDDLSYEHTPYTLLAVNGGVTQIGGMNGLASQSVSPTVQIRNLGTEDITSFDINISYNGTSFDESVSDVNVGSLDYYTADIDGMFDLVAGDNDVVATISNVNGNGSDDDPNDDVKTTTISPIVPAPGKMVLGEEGTGTWCQWCPRGAVFMDFMENTYGDFWAGVAVHNGDPMVYEEYDLGLQGLIGGYPSSLVDRGADIDPSAMEAAFLQQIVIPPTASILAGVEYNEDLNLLSISLSTQFMMDADGSDFNLAMVVTEDGVTGTGTGYNQANAYAGGGNGEMGGYEDLPSSVPASQMVYDHVGRTIMPSFAGAQDLFPSSVSTGDVFVSNYYVTLDESWDPENMHIIGMLINNNTNQVDNAGKANFEEAVNNGFILGVNETSMLSNFNVFPNPASDKTFIELGKTDGNEVSVKIFNLNGSVVAQRNYGNVGDDMIVPLSTDTWAKGVYMIQVTVGQDISNRKLVVD